jgi:hypothetical protein
LVHTKALLIPCYADLPQMRRITVLSVFQSDEKEYEWINPEFSAGTPVTRDFLYKWMIDKKVSFCCDYGGLAICL